MGTLDDARRERLVELAGECFDLAAGLVAADPHDPRTQRLLEALWLLREALQTPDDRPLADRSRPPARRSPRSPLS